MPDGRPAAVREPTNRNRTQTPFPQPRSRSTDTAASEPTEKRRGAD
jgi:hypothetical protein